MKALILAAGYGRRMQPLTRSCHKTMLKIGSRTVIEWIIDALCKRSIVDITIVTGYRAEELSEFVRLSYPHLQLTFVHNDRYGQTNNIHSLALAFQNMTINSDLLLIECDIIFEPAVLDRLLSSDQPNSAIVDRYSPGMDGTVVQLKCDTITAVIPSHMQDAAFDFTDKFKTLNIYRFSPEFCAGTFKKLLLYYASVIDDNQYYELVLGILVYLQHETIHAVVLNGELWTEIDDPNDLEVARFIFAANKRKELLDNAYGGYWNYPITDFRYLRNMYFPTPAVLAELRAALPDLVRNYGSSQATLNRKLAYYLCCSEQQLIALNGAAQIYPLLQQYFVDKRVAIPTPTFGEYHRIFPNAARYSDQRVFDYQQLEYLAHEHDILVLVNPNNPTGSCLSTAAVYDLAAACPDTIIILDESFIEFSTEQSILPMLEAAPLTNVLLLKSLSKTLGVPGLRLGFCYTFQQELLSFVGRSTPIWNLNSLAEHFLEIILKHRPEIEQSFQQTIIDRERFARMLEQLEVVRYVQRGGGNFLLVALDCDRNSASYLVSELLNYNIYVADVSDRFPDQQALLRVAVRLPQENALFAARLQQAALKVVAKVVE